MKISAVLSLAFVSAATAQTDNSGFSFSFTGLTPAAEKCLSTCISPMITNAATCAGVKLPTFQSTPGAPGTLQRRQTPAGGAAPASSDGGLSALFGNISQSLGQAAKAAQQAAALIGAQATKTRDCFCQADTQLKSAMSTCVPKTCPGSPEAVGSYATVINTTCRGVKGYKELAAPAAAASAPAAAKPAPAKPAAAKPAVAAPAAAAPRPAGTKSSD